MNPETNHANETTTELATRARKVELEVVTDATSVSEALAMARPLGAKHKKPHSRSVIARMPAKQREQLLVWLREENVSYKDAAAKCQKEFGIVVGTSAISLFFRTEQQQANMARIVQSAAYAQELMKSLGENKEEVFKALLQIVAQAIFENVAALEAGQKPDFKPLAELLPLLLAARKDARDQERFELEREQWEFDVVHACHAHLAELQAILADRGMDEPARLRAIRRRLFGKNPAAENSPADSEAAADD